MKKKAYMFFVMFILLIILYTGCSLPVFNDSDLNTEISEKLNENDSRAVTSTSVINLYQYRNEDYANLIDLYLDEANVPADTYYYTMSYSGDMPVQNCSGYVMVDEGGYADPNLLLLLSGNINIGYHILVVPSRIYTGQTYTISIILQNAAGQVVYTKYIKFVFEAPQSLFALGSADWTDTYAMTGLDDRLYIGQNNRIHKVNPSTGDYSVIGGAYWGTIEAMTSLDNKYFAVINGRLYYGYGY